MSQSIYEPHTMPACFAWAKQNSAFCACLQHQPAVLVPEETNFPLVRLTKTKAISLEASRRNGS